MGEIDISSNAGGKLMEKTDFIKDKTTNII
jgi:hypothetical protein